MTPDEVDTEVDHFALDEWVESAEGMMVKITAPERPKELGAVEWKQYYRSWCEYPEVWCADCEDYHVLIRPVGDVVGYCPECRKEPGLLELGTTRRMEEALNDI